MQIIDQSTRPNLLFIMTDKDFEMKRAYIEKILFSWLKATARVKFNSEFKITLKITR